MVVNQLIIRGPYFKIKDSIKKYENPDIVTVKIDGKSYKLNKLIIGRSKGTISVSHYYGSSYYWYNIRHTKENILKGNKLVFYNKFWNETGIAGKNKKIEFVLSDVGLRKVEKLLNF